MTNNNSVLVVLTQGRQDRGSRATLALSWACTSLALGMDVSLYLTMDGTVWSLTSATEGIQVDGFEPLEQYMEQFLELDGELLVCAPCTEYYCAFDRDQIATRLHPKATIVGLSTVVAKAANGATVVTF